MPCAAGARRAARARRPRRRSHSARILSVRSQFIIVTSACVKHEGDDPADFQHDADAGVSMHQSASAPRPLTEGAEGRLPFHHCAPAGPPAHRRASRACLLLLPSLLLLFFLRLFLLLPPHWGSHSGNLWHQPLAPSILSLPW